MNSFYLSQFATVAFIHLLAVASPGPDFAIVVRQSITYGRVTAVHVVGLFQPCKSFWAACTNCSSKEVMRGDFKVQQCQ